MSVNNVITRIKEEFGGSGGGHKLAGGIRISVPSYKQLIKRIDEIL
ncbi:MAG: DHH family phosphoesterase [Promethearchaeota archaeon]